MAVELLVHARDHAKAQKGFVQTVRNTTELTRYPWGRKETLPNYVVIRLIDVNVDDVSEYIKPWLNKVKVELLSQDVLKRRYIFTIAKSLITEFGASKGFTPEMIQYLIQNAGATQTAVTSDRSILTLDLPQNKSDKALVDVQDLFEEQVATRRFKLATSDVNAALANGGRLTTTFATVNSRRVDREA